MKTILIYDTETTGLPIWNQPSEHQDQPRITQLAAELCDEETGETLSAINFIIKPNDWIIPHDLENLTGITNSKAKKFGADMDDVLPVFIEMWKLADLRVAHNESFDMRMVRIEIMRHDFYSGESVGPGDGPEVPFADHWKYGASFCTQAGCTSILKLPPTEKMLAAGRNHPKSPNLAEAYKHFTGKELEGAHNAAIDIMACKAVYFGIKNHKQ